MLNMHVTINFAEGLVHLRAPLLTELTMKDHNCAHEALHGFSVFEEKCLHALGVCNVNGILYVAPAEFIIESAINY